MDGSHSTFIPGRLIVDNIIISHELIKGYGRKGISPRCMIKLDMQKAYDSLEWSFLGQVMISMKFPIKFVKWTMACISTVSYSILIINGSPTVMPCNITSMLRPAVLY